MDTSLSLPENDGEKADKVITRKSLKIFFCYAHQDEQWLQALKMQLRPLEKQKRIELWYDRDINAGADWQQEINWQLNTAEILLLLVSPDFIDSDYCYGKEMTRALSRHQQGEACVIPIILRPVHWQKTPLGELQALPTDAKPIAQWANSDEALYDVVDGINEVIEALNSNNSGELSPFKSANSFLKNYSKTVNRRRLSWRERYSHYLRWANRMYIFLSFLLIALLLVQSLTQYRFFQSSTGASSLVYHDPLNNDNNVDTEQEEWPEYTETLTHCSFASDGYHIGGSHPAFCIEQGIHYQDSIISVTMTILTGNPAGLIFRYSGNASAGYYFEVQPHRCDQEITGTDGCYHISMPNRPDILQNWTPSPAINTQGSNRLTVIAIGNRLSFLINRQYLTTVMDTHFSTGAIGFACYVPLQSSCEAVFSNLTVETIG